MPGTAGFVFGCHPNSALSLDRAFMLAHTATDTEVRVHIELCCRHTLNSIRSQESNGLIAHNNSSNHICFGHERGYHMIRFLSSAD